MASGYNSVKYLGLEDVKKVIDALGQLSEVTLNNHSLTLIVNKTGEATFTSNSWKLLNEIGCSCPLSKLISNAAKNYTLFCGDDCKYFLFILKEIFRAIYKKVNKSNELLIRKEIINEIHYMKFILPCIFQTIQDFSRGSSSGFTKDLNSVVSTFMLSRFSVCVSKVLSNLVCNFIQNICERDSLQTVLTYVISHFDIFCCKILSPLSESHVINGFLFYTKHIPHELNLEDVNFLVVWDLTMKVGIEDVAWSIKDESFVNQLNPMLIYKSIFEYFKSHCIKLIFTSSSCHKHLKLLCKENDIFLLDNLEKEEINHLLTCFQVHPLDSLDETIETKHIGKLSSVKLKSYNKSNFLHLQCINPPRFLKAHHILLSAPCITMWKECYSEILNCFKMILQWLSPQTNLCFRKKLMNKVQSEPKILLCSTKETKSCDMCSKIKLMFENVSKNVTHVSIVKPKIVDGALLPPCSWELMFRTGLEKVGEEPGSVSSVLLQAIHLAVTKSICKRIGVPFATVTDVKNMCEDYIIKCNSGEVRYLEPVVCKEVMINSILDLMLQLLKIDGIVYVK